MSINIEFSAVQSLIANKSFEELKTAGDKNYLIKEKTTTEQKDLYLIVGANEESTDDFQVQCNGIILEKDTNKVVCAAQNKLRTATVSQMGEILQNYGKGSVLSNEPGKIRIEYCEDGTIMRLYNYKGTWYTATTKCMNAKDSYWSSSKTFDEMFWEVFDQRCLDSLDTNYTYIFVLLHSENRIVVKHKKNGLVYISRINNETLEEDYKNVFYDYNFVWRPRYIPSINLNSFADYYLPFKRGIIIKLFNNSSRTWKTWTIDFEQYIITKAVRGNVPQIRLRYLELLSDPVLLQLLEKYYSEHRLIFTAIKSSLSKLVRSIHKLYVDSHIKHTVQVTEENMFHRTLKQLHAQYKKTNKPIQYEDVQAKLNSLDKHVLKKFLAWE